MASEERPEGRVVWITGASSGIGRDLALTLARSNDRVAASARSKDDLEALAAEAGVLDGSIDVFPCDVTDAEATAATVKAIEAALGPIDVAVLGAGTHQPVKAAEFKAKVLEKLVQVNLLGVGNCLEPLIGTMMARRAGRIAIVSSVAGYRGLPTAAYYGATKAALINLAEALKFDLDQAGIRIQLINPGFVDTPLTAKNDFPMPFLITTEAAAARIASGLDSNRFEITFPWRFTYLMKLLRLLPYRLYFPLVRRGVDG
jgi:short-subunit dehydrogenase